MKQKLLKFIVDDAGATSIEYAMIACGVAVAIVAAVTGLGSDLNTSYASVDTALK